MRKLYAILLVCLIAGFFLWPEPPIERTPGVLAPQPPRQQSLDQPAAVLQKNGFRIMPLARFEVQARVLLRKNYRFDTGAEIAPVDLALGWGRMSDSAVLEHIEFSQNHRFYYWRTRQFPIPRREIESFSANMHMIPATAAIEQRLKALRTGDLIRFAGYLVEARRDDGWHWRSSLTREDTGNGACELVWVEQLEVL